MDDVILPAADWRHWPGLDRVVDALGAAEGEARFVGGAVRDTLLGLGVADIDVATRHLPEDAMQRLKRAGIKVVPTGLAHGTVTAVIDSRPIEVTTLRRDVSTDGRHAIVAYTDDWQQDAARRDFTINALYADPLTGRVSDFFGGLDDLAARRVRFIGDPYQRIAEDHLRILRFFRFLARFGEAPDAEGLEACAARANDLMALSRERIADELLKLLLAKNAVSAIALMVSRGILRPVLPEIDAEGVHRLESLARHEAAFGIAPDAIRRLAALLPRDPAAGDAVGARLKLSNARRKRLASALTDERCASPRELAYRIGKDEAVDRLLLIGESDEALHLDLKPLDGWSLPRLPLTGGRLVERGLSRGPDVARTLRQIEDQWIAEGFPGQSRVDAIADDIVAQALRDRSS